MSATYFYHLTHEPLESALPKIIVKARAAGWRVVVRGTSDERLDWLDKQLWTQTAEGFLPHGRSGGKFDADQPVLLTNSSETPNDAACLIAIDRATISTDDVAKFERICLMFNGNNGDALDDARTQWKTLSDQGFEAQYWSQESGNWAKKADNSKTA